MADNSLSSGHSDEDQESSEGRGRRRDRHQPLRQISKSQSPPHNRPNMSDLRIALLGMSMSENSRVGNLILGKGVFVKKTPSSEVEEHSGRVEGRNITVISIDLLRLYLKLEAATQKAFELSRVNPDVIILVLQHNDFNQLHKDKLPSVLIYFGEQTMKRTMIVTTDDNKDSSTQQSVKENELIQQLSAECGGGRLQLLNTQRSDILQKVDNAVQRMVRNPDANHPNSAERETSDSECLRIVLIGRTGSGKSATGNTILGGKEVFSQLNTDSVTTVCKKGVGEVDGRSVAVVDTPGLFDTTLTNDQVVEEIMKCVSLSAPGPHVFIIVLSLGRFTKEETDTIDLIKKIFGPKSAQFSIVLFTRGDDLKGQPIEDYVSKYNCAELQKLIRDCGNRLLAFNNREKQDKTQVMKLLKMIEEVKSNNQGGYFTNDMFEKAEMSINKTMEEILIEREIQKQMEELQAKHEEEMKRLEEEKQRAEEEKIKMKKQLKLKEEKLRKEFEEEKTDQKKREIENQKRLEEEKQQRAEYDQRIEEIKREIENQRSQYEQQQKKREEEDRKREEKYRQDKEKMKSEQQQIIAELKKKQEEETKLRDLEEKKINEEEEEERQRWERRIKEAENERKEIQEEIKRQQREWEDEMKRNLREREEEERKIKEKHEEELREKQEELEKIRKRFEREREEERQKMEEERKEERERRKRDKERQKKERRRWKRMIEDLKKRAGRGD